MTKQGALAWIYDTYIEDQRSYADEETDDEFVERFIGPVLVQDDACAEIQREFGWDDTH